MHLYKDLDLFLSTQTEMNFFTISQRNSKKMIYKQKYIYTAIAKISKTKNVIWCLLV